MWGTVLIVAIVFAILFVVSRAAGYYRRQFSVVDAETGGQENVAASAAVGVGAGVAVLLLLLVLYMGVTRWDWAGQPVGGVHSVSTPAPISTSPNPVIPSTSPGVSPSS